jgi:hypothetical protein
MSPANPFFLFMMTRLQVGWKLNSYASGYILAVNKTPILLVFLAIDLLVWVQNFMLLLFNITNFYGVIVM